MHLFTHLLTHRGVVSDVTVFARHWPSLAVIGRHWPSVCQVCEGFLTLVVPKLRAREDIVVETYVRQRLIESLDLRLLVSDWPIGV